MPILSKSFDLCMFINMSTVNLDSMFECVYYSAPAVDWSVSVLAFWLWRCFVHDGISSKSMGKYNNFRLNLVIYPNFLHILDD